MRADRHGHLWAAEAVKRIAFIGGGNMAFALVGGLRAATETAGDDQLDIVVADPIPEQRARFEGVSTTPDNPVAVDAADAVVLAVKPQVMREVVESLPLTIRQLVISIAAGVTIEAIARWTPADQPIVRCMPNTPALLQAGITGMTANRFVDPGMQALAERILSAAGEVVWFDDEDSLHAVTAVSGSGPAYAFYLLEGMIEAGVELGLDPATAERLATATVLGAARMAQVGDVGPGVLRERVTSPGGTTERALSILESAQVRAKFKRAIQAACERSRELAEEFGK